MKRLRLEVLAVLCLCGIAAQAQLTTVTAAHLRIGGVDIPTGKVLFTPVNAQGSATSFAQGGGGLNGPQAFACTITSGALSGCTVPDAALTTQANILYTIQVLDTSTGGPTSGLAFTLTGVPGVSGTTWALDAYGPPIGTSSFQSIQVASGPTVPSTCNVPSFFTRTSSGGAFYFCYNGGFVLTGSGGGSMTWPAGGAGIPNYNGSSGYGTSYSATNKIPANFIAALAYLPSTTVLASSISAAANNFLTAYDAVSGNFTAARPSFANLSGLIAVSQMDSGTNAIAGKYWEGTGHWTTPPGGASSAGANHAVQTGDGSGGLTDSGCGATTGAMTCGSFLSSDTVNNSSDQKITGSGGDATIPSAASANNVNDAIKGGVPQASIGNQDSGAYKPYLLLQPFHTLTDGATVTWATAGIPVSNAKVTLAGNRTLALTGLVNGATGIIEIIQDGTGSRTLTLGSGCTWKVGGGGSGAITLSTAAGAIDVLTFLYDGTNCIANFRGNFN